MTWVLTCPSGHQQTIAEDRVLRGVSFECPICRDGEESFPPPPIASPAGPDARATFREAALRAKANSSGSSTDSSGTHYESRKPRDGEALPKIPGFDVQEEIGAGGMGIVYRAWQLELKRTVALKLIQGGVGSRGSQADRFRKEATAAAGLRHPNVTQVYEIGEHDGRPFLVLEYADAGSLSQHLDGSPLPADVSAELVTQLASAVHQAHSQGIVHRDLKPGNILLVSSEREDAIALSPERAERKRFAPKIADFGLAKSTTPADDHDTTQTGAVLGTPSYMAPEQALGQAKTAGPAADVYSLGAILYDLLTGRPPFRAASFLETLEQVRHEEPLAPARLQPHVPRDLQTICLKCLEKDPHRRYESAAALSEDLRRYLRGEPIEARPVSRIERAIKWSRRKPAVAALTVVSVVGVIAFIGTTLWHNQRLQAEVIRANEGEAAALKNLNSGYETLDEVTREVVWLAGGSEYSLRLRDRMYDKALAFYYETLQDADESHPDVRFAKAKLLVYSGSIHNAKKQYARGLEDLELARARLERLHEDAPEDEQIAESLERCFFHQGAAFDWLGEKDKAEQHYKRSIDIASKLAASGATLPRLKQKLAFQQQTLARLYRDTARDEMSSRLLRSVIALRLQILAAAPDDEQNRVMLADSCELLWKQAFRAQQWDETESLLQRAERALLAGKTETAAVARTLARVCQQWGRLHAARLEPEQMLARSDQAIALLDELSRRQSDRETRRLLHTLHHEKAWTLSRAGRWSEAFSAWGLAIESAEGPDRVFNLAMRALERANAGQYQVAAAEADELRLRSDLSPAMFFTLARAYGKAITVAQDDDQLDLAARSRVVADYAANALQALRRAADAGYFTDSRHIQQLDDDEHFTPLRDSPEFVQWRASLR